MGREPAHCAQCYINVGLDNAMATYLVGNMFLQWAPGAPVFEVPPSPAFLEEPKCCWADQIAFACHSRDARTLDFMHNAREHGLDHGPLVDGCIALRILLPDEALKNNDCGPWPQCRVTDSLLTRAHDTAAQTAHIGNSLSVLLLAEFQMLQPEHEGKELGDMNDVALYLV